MNIEWRFTVTVESPTNFSLSLEIDKLKLVGHQTEPLPNIEAPFGGFTANSYNEISLKEKAK